MKILVSIILALTITIKTNAQQNQSPSLLIMSFNAGIYAIGFCAYNHIDPKHPQTHYSQKSPFISLGFNPQMSIKESAGDIITKAGLTFRKNEMYLSSEIFGAIDYYSMGLGYDRLLIDRKMSLLTGVEYTIIDKPKGHYHSSIGINLTSRYNINKNISVQLTSNLRTSPDNSKPHLNNHLAVNIKLFKDAETNCKNYYKKMRFHPAHKHSHN